MPTTMSHDHATEVKKDKNLFDSHVKKIIDATYPQFCRIIQSYVKFNLLFASLALAEVVIFLGFFAFWVHSLLIAFILAAFFLTIFSFFTLRIYLQTKKSEQLNELKQRYIDDCRKLISYREGCPEYLLALSHACYLFAASLQGKENRQYAPFRWLEMATPLMNQWSRWWHWYDFHKMKELLLQVSVDEHVNLVICEPTSLEAHAALANAYVMLSGLYVDPLKIEGLEEEERWSLPSQFVELMQQKFRKTAEKAIEEFKILNDYAPNDPWVHAQLAYSYHDLQMPLEEIREYETILKLRPDDKETLFKLGMLYFQQGMNAKGLRVYEELKKTHYIKAENLIKHYGG